MLQPTAVLFFIATMQDPASERAVVEANLSKQAMQLDADVLAGAESKAAWELMRPKLKEQYFEMLGLWPLPPRTPLDPQVTGRIERDEGFVIEKLHFQSRPHLYVTANLYRPTHVEPGEKLPAVLYVCGHSGRGRDGNKTAFQHHGMWFATHGYVCLIIDSLQLGEIAGIHHGTYRFNRWWWHSRGYTPAGVECWNGIRAIDYLQSRPEVDPDRIAVTGISGGGAASFWIAAADERVKVAVPVSGMSDLQDYVGGKVINGHCDCMFLINTYRWSWTRIAALVAPRPLLFENSGHDPIFPMTANDRIRARLEHLYRLYTDKPADLFDIGVTPGGHDDNPELRLMAYRWINRHLKKDNSPVTEPVLPPVEGGRLRAFPDALPADDLNTRIDESFVPLAETALPKNAGEFQAWQSETAQALRRRCFGDFRRAPSLVQPAVLAFAQAVRDGAREGRWDGDMPVAWRYFPSKRSSAGIWLLVVNADESFGDVPDWARSTVADASVLLIAPRRWEDQPPYYVQRSHALLGLSVDSGRVIDVVRLADAALHLPGSNESRIRIAGRGQAGVIAAYAAMLTPQIAEVVAIAPPTSHRNGPYFLNVLRVTDIPDALGLLAPRPLRIETATPAAFERTVAIYAAANAAKQLVISSAP